MNKIIEHVITTRTVTPSINAILVSLAITVVGRQLQMKPFERIKSPMDKYIHRIYCSNIVYYVVNVFI